MLGAVKKKGLYNPSLKIFFFFGVKPAWGACKEFQEELQSFFSFLFNLIFKDTGRLEVWHHPPEPDSEAWLGAAGLEGMMYRRRISSCRAAASLTRVCWLPRFRTEASGSR